MPTLDDIPTLSAISGLSSDDLIPIIDLTAAGSSRVRKLTIQNLTTEVGNTSAGFGGVTASVVNETVAKAITAAQPMTFISGTFTDPAASGVVTFTLPPVSTNNLKAITVSAAFNQTFTTGGAAATLVVAAPAANTLFIPNSSGAGVAVTNVTLPVGFVYRFRTNGTNWYRIS